MVTIVFAIVLFLDIIRFCIIADIILSWLTLLGLKIRPKFLSDIIDPIYWLVKKYIPTTIWIFDLTPIVIIFILIFIKWLLIINFPEVQILIQKLQSNL